jgi:uncharacterized protein (DUF433 family)
MATAAKAIAYAHITKEPGVRGGRACIDRTRIAVMDIVQAQSEGKTPQEIQDLFAVQLSLAQVHAALAYYYDHKDEIEAEFAEEDGFEEQIERERAEYLKKRPSSQ